MHENQLEAVEEQIQSSTPVEDTMRSELVFATVAHVPNRFQLTKLAATATRKFHRPNARVEETVSDVLARFSHVNPHPGTQNSGNLQANRHTEIARPHYMNRTPALA
jgi:hypothetical protein